MLGQWGCCLIFLPIPKNKQWSSAAMVRFLHGKMGAMESVRGLSGILWGNKREKVGETFYMRPRSYHLVVMVTVPSMSWSVTYIAMDKIQTACQCRSQWWFHTRAIHLSAQRWCSRRTTCFQTWTEMRRWLRLNCPARSTWLWGHRGLHLEWEWPVSVSWLHMASWRSCSHASDLQTLVPSASP